MRRRTTAYSRWFHVLSAASGLVAVLLGLPAAARAQEMDAFFDDEIGLRNRDVQLIMLVVPMAAQL